MIAITWWSYFPFANITIIKFIEIIITVPIDSSVGSTCFRKTEVLAWSIYTLTSRNMHRVMYKWFENKYGKNKLNALNSINKSFKQKIIYNTYDRR